MKKLGMFAVVLACALCGFGTAQAEASKPLTFDGNIELRTPVFNSLPGFGWGGSHTIRPEVVGTVNLHNLFNSKMVFWVSGEHTFQQVGTFAPENKLKIGVDYPVSHSFTVFTYFDRRFNSEVNRVFVGFRVGFRGRLSD